MTWLFAGVTLSAEPPTWLLVFYFFESLFGLFSTLPGLPAGLSDINILYQILILVFDTINTSPVLVLSTVPLPGHS